ncbi:MAG TPA: ABC transporter permease [Jatrophihabitantaceae bacterium]|jgi:ribose transport system permease protein
MTVTTAAPRVDVPREARPGRARLVVHAIGVQNISLLIALAALVTFIGIRNSNFFLVSNLKTIGTTVSIVGVLAIVQTVVMLIGALDISVGSAAGLASVVSAMVFTSASGSAALGMLAAIGVGILAGLFNGLVIIYGRVNAVIATLATYAGYRGLANLITDGRAQGYTGKDPTFVFIARGAIAGIPTLIWILAVIAVVVHLLLRYTDIGRNIYAMGGNPTAARLAGINLNRYVIGCYVAVGVVAAIAGIMLTARTGSGQPTSGSQGLELQSITAAALGGVAMQGGKGTVSGTILAVLLLGVLQNGLTILDVNSFWQDIAQGFLLVIAVIIQQRRRGVRAIGLP